MPVGISIEEAIKNSSIRIEKLENFIKTQQTKINLSEQNKNNDLDISKYPNLIKQFSPEELKEITNKIYQNEKEKLILLEKELTLESNKKLILLQIKSDEKFTQKFNKYTGVNETFDRNLKQSINEKSILIADTSDQKIYKFQGYEENYEKIKLVSISDPEERKEVVKLTNDDKARLKILNYNGMIPMYKEEFGQNITKEEKEFLSSVENDIKNNLFEFSEYTSPNRKITSEKIETVNNEKLILKEKVIGLNKFEENPDSTFPLMKVKLQYNGKIDFSLLNGKEINQIISLGEKEFLKNQVENRIKINDEIFKDIESEKKFYRNVAKETILGLPLTSSDNELTKESQLQTLENKILILGKIENWIKKANNLLKEENKETLSLKNNNDTKKEKIIYVPKKENSPKKGISI